MVTDAYLAKYAEESLDGGLYVEGGHLDRIQIGPDGRIQAALIVLHRRPRVGGPSSIRVDLVYPWGGRADEYIVFDIPPQEFVSQDGSMFIDFGMDAPVEGHYKLVVSGGGGEVTVPVELFQAPGAQA